MKGSFISIILLFVFLLLIVPGPLSAQQSNVSDFLDTLREKGVLPEDEAWNRQFQEEYSKLMEKHRINPQTYRVLFRSMQGSRLRGNPRETAEFLSRTTQWADREMRRGETTIEIQQRIKQTVERAQREQEARANSNNGLPADPPGLVRAADRIKNKLETKGRGKSPPFTPPGQEKKRGTPPEHHPEKDQNPGQDADTPGQGEDIPGQGADPPEQSADLPGKTKE